MGPLDVTPASSVPNWLGTEGEAGVRRGGSGVHRGDPHGKPSAEPRASALVIGGFEPFSMVDWPGHLAATVFLQGCPWRCTYCHNPALQDPRAPAVTTWERVLETLQARIGQLDGVVFSGGEPTRQAALAPAMREARALGYKIALHTAGIFPARLASVLPLVDWVGLDIKASPHRYGAITGTDAAGERAWAALEEVRRSAVEFEVRITVDPTVHTRTEIIELVDELAARGVPHPVLQQARPDGASPAYATALAGRGLYDVLHQGDLPNIAVR